MIKFLKQNFIIKCISLFLALGLWLYVMNEEDPAYTTNESVHISIVNAPNNYQILHNTDTINIKIRAPRSLFANLDSSNIKATVNLKNITEGTHDLPVTVKLPTGFDLVSYSPETVHFSINKIITKTVPVDLILSGKPANDLVVTNIKQSFSHIDIEGPRPQINTVNHVVGYIGLDGNTEDFSVIVPLRAVNKNGVEVDGVNLPKNTVNASIYFARGLNKKTVSIRPTFSSDLPEGLSIDDFSILPSQIEITGNPKIISTINFINTDRIPLNALQKGDVTVKLDLPTGITSNNKTVTISRKKK